MTHTIKLTDEQHEALKNGESITIEPPKKKPELWAPSESDKEGHTVITAGETRELAAFNSALVKFKALNFNVFKTHKIAYEASKLMRINNALISAAKSVDPDFNQFTHVGGFYGLEFNNRINRWVVVLRAGSYDPAGTSTREKAEQAAEIVNGLDLFGEKK